MLPAVAKSVLHGGPHALGAMMGAAGGGALVGALYLASRDTTRGLGTVIARCGLGLGCGLICLEGAANVWESIPILFVIGMSLMVQMASTNTLVQTLVPEDKLGRVMSLYAMAFFGGAPIGALIEGSLASVIGPIHTMALAGAAVLVCALAFRRTIVRE
jgi:hypothetical protein